MNAVQLDKLRTAERQRWQKTHPIANVQDAFEAGFNCGMTRMRQIMLGIMASGQDVVIAAMKEADMDYA